MSPANRSLNFEQRLIGKGSFLCLSLCLFLLVNFYIQPTTVKAQTKSLPAYWRYDAVGPIIEVIPVDVNNDEIQELLVMAEDLETYTLDLVLADSERVWRYSTEEPIKQVMAINADGVGQKEILVQTESSLLLLKSEKVVNSPSSIPPVIWKIDLLERGVSSWATFSPYLNSQQEDILLLTDLYRLYRLNGEGEKIWIYDLLDDRGKGIPEHAPVMEIMDLEGDGRDEILLGLSVPGGSVSPLRLINYRGNTLRGLIPRKEIPGREVALGFGHITAMEAIQKANGEWRVAVANTNQAYSTLSMIDIQNEKLLWYRTPNKPVTHLLAIDLEEEDPVVIAGTRVGTVFAYTVAGKQLWQTHYFDEATHPVIDIKTNAIVVDVISRMPPKLLAITFGNSLDENQSDLILIDDKGDLVQRHSFDQAAESLQFTDINVDGWGELLRTSYATIELGALGIGNQEILPGWIHELNAQPQVTLVADLDRNGKDEMVVGTVDGRLVFLENAGNSVVLASVQLEGSITHLALLDNKTLSPKILVVHLLPQDGQGETPQQVVRLINGTKGTTEWENIIDSPITQLLVADVNDDVIDEIVDSNQIPGVGEGGRPEIIVGTENGEVLLFEQSGELLAQQQVNGSIEKIALLTQVQKSLIVATRSQLFTIGKEGGTNQFVTKLLKAYTNQQIRDIYVVPRRIRQATRLFLTFDNAISQWLDIDAREGELKILSGPEVPPSFGIPKQVIQTADSFFVATNQDIVMRLDFQANILQQWVLNDVLTLYGGRFAGNDNVVVGNREGQVRIYAQDQEQPWYTLEMGSSIFFVSSLENVEEEAQDIVVISENGIIRQFDIQPNRPPFLGQPQIDIAQNQYDVSVFANDLENEEVAVVLETLNTSNNSWLSQQRSSVVGGGRVTLSIDPDLAKNGLTYRLRYFAGPHEGLLGPLTGAPAIVDPVGISSRWFWLLGMILLGGSALVWQLNRSTIAKTWRVAQQLRKSPPDTLEVLATEYQQYKGAPGFLLNLANQARKNNNALLAGLAEGLFLLEERPETALDVLNETLSMALAQNVAWTGLTLWQANCRQAYDLLVAPSITELSLLRPQLVALLQQQNKANETVLGFETLLPILTALRDSERVDMGDDRLVYLHEASVLVKQVQVQLIGWAPRISTQIVQAICKRWHGLIHAGIEELRGQAKLVATLKTKHIAPKDSAIEVTLELENIGRASAENIVIQLVENPAYELNSSHAYIRFLPPGRSRQVNIQLIPQVTDRFRIVFNILYDDRQHKEKTLAFGDMVHLLVPDRPFVPVANPYLPGTPLRRRSALFYGRAELFRFIAENVCRVEQRNPLILVGQRRTGKTSALLRLEQYLPDFVLSVYVDCQSFGVTPGMPAFLHDIAWLVADALATRDVTIDIDPLEEWEANPTNKFQREFIPDVLKLLPDDGIVLLVFDEFEALENLVDDDILPPILFTYLRHLMQHAKGLGFIFTGTHQLVEMSTDYWSILFNIALYRQIGYLDNESAIQLITKPVAPHLIYDDLALDKILRVTAGHPYFLQLVCYTLVAQANRKRTPYITISDVNAGIDEMLRLGEVHFAYLWQRSTKTERLILTVVAHLLDRDLPFRPTDILQCLAEYDTQLPPTELIAGLDRLVEREIMAKQSGEATPLYELRIGLVGLWTAQTKSLSKLYKEKLVVTG